MLHKNHFARKPERCIEKIERLHNYTSSTRYIQPHTDIYRYNPVGGWIDIFGVGVEVNNFVVISNRVQKTHCERRVWWRLKRTLVNDIISRAYLTKNVNPQNDFFFLSSMMAHEMRLCSVCVMRVNDKITPLYFSSFFSSSDYGDMVTDIYPPDG